MDPAGESQQLDHGRGAEQARRTALAGGLPGASQRPASAPGGGGGRTAGWRGISLLRVPTLFALAETWGFGKVTTEGRHAEPQVTAFAREP